ncbi:MAG: tetratricopeptide repeat protein [Deltaproteobacteria bacterium]|nr:tetratricopeptide repeat protein [Deltaproteobacteria bacterium]
MEEWGAGSRTRRVVKSFTTTHLLRPTPHCASLINLLIALVVFFAGCSTDPAEHVFEKAEKSLGTGSFEEALLQYSYVVNKHPESSYAPKSQYKIAYIYNKYLGERKRALDAYATLYYMYPGSAETVDAREDLAQIYSDLGDHRKAIAHYQRLMVERPGDAQRFHFAVASEYMKMNDLAQARVEFSELLRTTGSHVLIPQIYFNMGGMSYVEGKTSEAMEWYDKLISKYPKDPFVLEAEFYKAKVLNETGRQGEALVLLREIEPQYHNKAAVTALREWIEARLKDGHDPKTLPPGVNPP